MSWLEIAGASLGIPLAFLGIIGGLLSMWERFNKWRIARHPRGSRGVRVVHLGWFEQDGFRHYRMLAVGDIEQILKPMAEELDILSVESAGEYYFIKSRGESGRDYSLRINKNKQK